MTTYYTVVCIFDNDPTTISPFCWIYHSLEAAKSAVGDDLLEMIGEEEMTEEEIATAKVIEWNGDPLEDRGYAASGNVLYIVSQVKMSR